LQFNEFVVGELALSELDWAKDHKYLKLYNILAEVPSAAQVNLQPAQHLKNVFFSF